MAEGRGRRWSDKWMPIFAIALSSLAGWALYQFGAAQQRARESKVREIVLEEMVEAKPMMEKDRTVTWHP